MAERRAELEVSMLKDGSGYCINVTWLDGRRVPQQIEGFKTADEAHAWISNPPPAWREELGIQ